MSTKIEDGARCGWCLTKQCEKCLPKGDGWECHCKHTNIRRQRETKVQTSTTSNGTSFWE